MAWQDRSVRHFEVMAAVMVAAIALGGSGCGRQVVGVAKPNALLAWEPHSADPSARITTVSSTAERMYVGFSDGELFFRANAGGAQWTPFKTNQAGCNPPMPRDAVTALAIAAKGLTATEQTVFAAYAGAPGSIKIWRSPPDHPCWAGGTIAADLWSVSVSPFSSIDLLAVSADLVWVSQSFGQTWNDLGPLPLNFGGTAQALGSGVGVGGAARAWLGDAVGNLYYSDDVDSATAPTSIAWQLVPSPGFPHRPVVAIATRAERPDTIWVTFAGLFADSLWTSMDDGVTWQNPRGGEIASVVQPEGADAAAPGDAQAPPAGSARAGFGAVSPVPGLDVAYVTALTPDRNGVLIATAFWTLEGTDEWWRQ
jgi:hypothetical protein